MEPGCKLNYIRLQSLASNHYQTKPPHPPPQQQQQKDQKAPQSKSRANAEISDF